MAVLVDQSNEDNKDTECGMFGCHPRWLRKFNTPLTFLIVFSSLSLVQGAFWTYFIGVITTIEKRYAFESKITGIILLADNLSPIITSFIIGFFGGRGNRPLWLGAGMFVAGISSFMSAMPYWIYGPPSTGSGLSIASTKDQMLCTSITNAATSEAPTCESNDENAITMPAVLLLFLGNFVNGIGSTSFYVIGSSYLDDSISKTSAPLYFGIMSCIRLFGPSLGFLLAASLLKHYENPLVSPEFDDKDPRWVGAWWIGFVIIGIALVILSFILLLFPKEIPWADNKKQLKMQEQRPFKEKLADFPKDVVKVMKNKLLICTTLGHCFYFMAALGFFQYMPKFVESQFRQSASNSNAIAGITSTVVMALGFLLSGVIISKLKPRPRFVSGWVVFVDAFNCLGMLIAMNFGCDSNNIEGGQMQNDDCNCGYKVMQPVCDKNNTQTYFSACHAGCTSFSMLNGTKMLEGCHLEDASMSDVVSGFCPSTCTSLLYYMIVIVITKALGSTSKVGTLIIALRSVETHDKALALSVVSSFSNLIANIPSPLIYGAIVDAACNIWKFSCGKQGNCWAYDSANFRFYLHGVTAFIYFMAMIFDMMMCYYSKRLTNMYDDDNIDNKDKKHGTDQSGSGQDYEMSKL